MWLELLLGTSNTMSGSDTFTVFQKKYFVERDVYQTSVVWKIFHIGKRVYLNDEVRPVISPVFQCSNYVFDIEIRPYLKNESDVFLRKLNTESGNCHLYYKFKIFDLTNKKVHDSSTFEWINFYPTHYGKKVPSQNLFNPKDSTQCVTIFLDVILDGTDSAADSFRNSTEVLRDEISNLVHHTDYLSLSRDFEELFDNPVSADVTLKLGTEEIPAHKCVLSRSSVFRAMFTHSMKENQQNTVCIEEIEPKIFKELLRYIYCGKVRQLTPDEVLDLYVAADRYQLIGLVTICRELLTMGMSVKNVCTLAEIASFHNDEFLIDTLKSFLKENSADLIETEEWTVFSAAKPFLSIEMLEWAVSRH